MLYVRVAFIAMVRRCNTLMISNAKFLRSVICFGHNERIARNPTTVAVDACGNSTTWALETLVKNLQHTAVDAELEPALC